MTNLTMEQMRELQKRVKEIDIIVDVRNEHISNFKDRVIHLLTTHDSGYNIYGLPTINDSLENLCESFKDDVVAHYERVIENMSSSIETEFNVKLKIDLGENGQA